jgi:hypothetical protein
VLQLLRALQKTGVTWMCHRNDRIFVLTFPYQKMKTFFYPVYSIFLYVTGVTVLQVGFSKGSNRNAFSKTASYSKLQQVTASKTHLPAIANKS